MKRLLIVFCLTALLTLSSIASPPDCASGWLYIGSEVIFQGGGCNIIRNTYACFSSGTTMQCDSIQCNDGPIVELECE